MAWGDLQTGHNPSQRDLESPSAPDLWVQEFLTWEEMSWAGEECKDDPNWPAMPKPSLEDSNNWTLWHAYWVETLSWWPELQDAESEVPHPKMENNYSVLPTPHCINRDAFLPFNNMQFGGQYYHLKQLQKTLVYTRALQQWVEKARTPMPGEPGQLAECVQELREVMESLMVFTDAKVFSDDVPSHQDVMSGITYIDMVTCSMSLVGLEATPSAVDHPMRTLKGWRTWILTKSPTLQIVHFCW